MEETLKAEMVWVPAMFKVNNCLKHAYLYSHAAASLQLANIFNDPAQDLTSTSSCRKAGCYSNKLAGGILPQ